MAEPSDHEEELWTQFETSARSVVDAFKKFEESVIRPTSKFVEVAFKRYPITSTFVSVFLILAGLPLLSFLAFFVFVVTSVTFTSLCAALVASAFIIGLYGTFITMLVLVLAALSLWISTGLVFGFISWRLFTLVRAGGRAGVSQWSVETRKRFRRQNKESEERRGRSRESVVLVKKEDTDTSPDKTTNETTKESS